jgi:hypothetical protein
MFNEQQILDTESAVRILESYDAVFSIKESRLDYIDNAYKIGRKVYFTETYPLKQITTPRQGWVEGTVLEMLNIIMSYLNKPLVKKLSQFDATLNEHDKAKILRIIPPIILSLLPDDSVHTSDGNHRYALAKILQLEYLPAFIVKDF